MMFDPRSTLAGRPSRTLDRGAGPLARVRALWRDELGQDMTEYVLLLSLIAVFLVLTLTDVSDAISGAFSDVIAAWP